MSKSHWRAVLYCALALVSVVGGAAIAAANGYLTRPITHWLGVQLGRELHADAGLRIYIGRVTRIRAAQLRLANTPWSTRKDMVLAQDLAIDIDTISLLHDTVIVRRLMIVGLDLRLERNADGLNNWTFRAHEPRRNGVVPLIIEYAALPGAHVQFIGPNLQGPLDVEFDSFEQHALADGMLNLAARGQANGTSLELRTQVGPLANVIAGREFKIAADGRLGEIALGINGQIDSVSEPVNTQIAVELQAPDADYLTTHTGLRSLGAGPVALKVTVRPATSGTGLGGDLVGQIGAFQVTARGSLLVHQGTRDMAIEGRVAGPDLSRMGAIVGVKRLPVEPFQLQLAIQQTGQSLIIKRAELAIANGLLNASGTIGPGAKFAESDLKFGAEIPDVTKIKDPWGISKVLKGRFSGTAHLSHPTPGEAHLQLDGTTNLGKLTLLGTVGAAPDYLGTKLSFTLSGADFGPLGRVLRLPDPPSGDYRATGDAEWRHAGILLRTAVLRLATESLQINGNLGRRPFAPGADLNFELGGESAARLAGLFGLSGWPVSKYHIAGRVQRLKGSVLLRNVTVTVAGSSLQLDGALGDFPDLLGTSLAFKLSGTAIENFGGLLPVPDALHGAFAASGQASIVGGELQVSKAQLRLADAQATLSAEIGLPLDRATMRFDIDAKIPDLGRLLPRVGGSAALGSNLTISVAGARDGRQWSLKRLNLTSDGGLLKTQGELVLTPQFSAKSVPFELRTMSLRKLGLRSGRDWPDEPLELRATLSQSADDVELDNLAGKLGGSVFAGNVAVHGGDSKPNYDLRLEFERLDLDPYIGKSEVSTVPASPAAKSNVNDQPLVIPGKEFQLPDLSAYSGKLSLRARTMRARGQDFSNLEVLATLRNGRLHVDPLAITGAAGQLNARFDVAEKGKAVKAQISATAKKLKFSLIPFRLGDPNSGLYSAQVDLQGSGASWRELAATLNGRVRLVGNGGRIPNSRLTGTSSGFMKQLVVSLNPMVSRQPATEVVCTAYLLKAQDGVVTTDPALVVRTAEVDIVSNGSMDLRSEKIDLSFKIGARKGLGLGVVQVINPYIKVTGTLSKPGVTLDPTGALVNGGAAFATAGLSIVATTLWDRVVHEKDPCGAAVAESDRRVQK